MGTGVGRTQTCRVIYDVVSGKKIACSHCPRFPRALPKNTIWTRKAFGLDAFVASSFNLRKLGGFVRVPSCSSL